MLKEETKCVVLLASLGHHLMSKIKKLMLLLKCQPLTQCESQSVMINSSTVLAFGGVCVGVFREQKERLVDKKLIEMRKV